MAELKLFILEDDEATRASLVRRLHGKPGLRVWGEAGSLAEADVLLSAGKPDILLVDLQLPDGDATELIARQAALRPELPVLVISVFGDELRVVRAIEAGARGYLLKDDAGDDIAQAVTRAVAGESPLSPAIARHLIRRLRPEASRGPNAPAAMEPVLSKREFEVLRLASKGLTYQETAQLLEVSVNTVGTYTRRIYQKLSVGSRAEALFEARQRGLMRDVE
jgi:DNA-binding NarL/FixJ family response regulator